jgi:hypothetical protein
MNIRARRKVDMSCRTLFVGNVCGVQNELMDRSTGGLSVPPGVNGGPF